MTQIPHPLMQTGEDVSEMKNYAVKFVAVIHGVVYVSASNKQNAAQSFKDDEDKAFDRIEKFEKYKITTVEEVDNG